MNDRQKIVLDDLAILLDKKCLRYLKTHVSASGLNSFLRFFVARDSSIVEVTRLISLALDLRLDPKKRGVKVSGYGLDLGDYIASTLSKLLYDDEMKLQREVL